MNGTHLLLIVNLMNHGAPADKFLSCLKVLTGYHLLVPGIIYIFRDGICPVNPFIMVSL